ncbi:hypothetical protein H4217_001611 [Coemansia sp. RSA 1939]|nr:hypothetical protein H4217_001611 [Coemansia sp. RSA 1939]KAJ2610473.1 hypothetical protein EV177_003955 [Coemansia sp. RSA 1804]KAJ2694813.1 hypothetical protein GGH99_000474 [Coemansia sp. RSA 1285]
MAVTRLPPSQGLLFDLDGTLITSLEATERVYTRHANMHGIDPAPVLAYCHGVPTRQVLQKHFPAATHTKEYAEAMELESASDMGGLCAIPGAMELVAGLPETRWAIVTSGMRFLAHPRMNHLGMRIPSVFVTPADVARGKPDPEGYLRAAREIGADPGACVVFEDARAGIAAGRDAGALVVGIRSQLTDAELKAAGAQYSVSDMTKVAVAVSEDGSLAVTLDES